MCVCHNFVHKCACVSMFILCSLSCGWCSFAYVPSREIGSFPVGTICSNLFCCYLCHIYRIRAIYYCISEGNDRELCVPLWLSEWLYCLWNIYFTAVQIFIWHAKCPAHLLQRQNILPWLCKTVALSSFIRSLCLGWLRRRS